MASGPPPPMPNFVLNGDLAIFFCYLVFVGAGVAAVVQFPKLVKHLRRHGRYGYFFLSSSAHHDSQISRDPSSSESRKGLVMGESRIKNFTWTLRKTLMKRLPFTNGLSIGKILVIIIYLTVSVTLSLYKNSDGTLSLTNFKRFGFLAISQLPITFALSMKNSPLGFFIGEGYEKLNFLHRVAGRMMFLFALVHGSLLLRLQYKATGSINVSHAPAVYGFSALVTMFVMGLTGWRVFRQRFYQTFLATHILGYVVTIACLWKHVPETHPYISAAIAFLVFDHVVKVLKTRYTHATMVAMPGELTRIEVRGVSDGWRAGQHVFLRVLNGRNVLEKHPFTIANAPSHASPQGLTRDLVLVAKAAGDFTNRIHQNTLKSEAMDVEKKNGSVLSMTNHPQAQLRVLVEGPYGASFHDFTTYETAVLCAGGSGFTFCMGLFEEIIGKAARRAPVATRNIELIWVLRDSEMVASFGKAIEDALVEATTHTDLKIRIHLYLTNTSQELGKINPLSNTPVEFHQGVRPDFRDVLGQVAGRSISLAIGVCGPTALVDHVQAAAREIETSGLTKIAIHSERFGW